MAATTIEWIGIIREGLNPVQFRIAANNGYGQELRYCNIKEIWDDLWKNSDFERREKEVRTL